MVEFWLKFPEVFFRNFEAWPNVHYPPFIIRLHCFNSICFTGMGQELPTLRCCIQAWARHDLHSLRQNHQTRGRRCDHRQNTENKLQPTLPNFQLKRTWRMNLAGVCYQTVFFCTSLLSTKFLQYLHFFYFFIAERIFAAFTTSPLRVIFVGSKSDL